MSKSKKIKKPQSRARAAKKTPARAAKTPRAPVAKAKPPARKSAHASASARPFKGLLTRKIREAQTCKVLLLLSTGNTCRSSMATFYLRKLLEERGIRNIEVRSAGVMTIAGLLATDESKLMLEPYGIRLDRHRSQPLTEEMIRRADLILGMTPFHVQMALRLSSSAREKTHLLKEYAKMEGRERNRPIPDPMGCTLEVYKRCFRQIKQACDRLIDMEFITGKTVKAQRVTAPAGARPAVERAKSPLRNKMKPAAGRASRASRSRAANKAKPTAKPKAKPTKPTAKPKAKPTKSTAKSKSRPTKSKAKSTAKGKSTKRTTKTGQSRSKRKS